MMTSRQARQAEMWGYWGRKENNGEKKKNLESVFNAYAKQNRLSQKELKNAFDHLGSLMPYKDAEEAMKAANISKESFVNCGFKEFNQIVEYAINKGFGDSV